MSMRQIRVSTTVFSAIWAQRLDGEEDEDTILRRVLVGGKTPNLVSKSRLTTFGDASPSASPAEYAVHAPDSEMEAQEQPNEAMLHAPWWKLISHVIEELGGEAHLSEIYTKTRELCVSLKRPIPSKFKETIRGTIFDNSSDSERYKSIRDIFRASHGKNSGYWANRSDEIPT